ncbi:helix-turn-helix transcriptional regulator [Ancylomarina sp.]|uniref:helix-turn-helix domain-containing protein n=1 Tax=Ancylomarina sp. TaxID=1970196 RepID=UPI00356AEA0B
MIVYDSALISVDFNESKGLLLSKWKQAGMSAADFKSELILCRDLCCSLKVQRIIMDQEQFCFIIPNELFVWIEDEINLPAYRAGVQDLVFVLAQDSKTQLSVMNSLDKADSVFNPKFFHDQQQAIDWITANRKNKAIVEPNRPPETFEPCIDISLNPNKTRATIKLELPIDSLPHSLHALKQHMDKINHRRENWTKFSSLTKREQIILKFLVKCFQNQGIANKLFISEKTVKTHRRNIIKKLEARNLIDLYKYAESFDLI